MRHSMVAAFAAAALVAAELTPAAQVPAPPAPAVRSVKGFEKLQAWASQVHAHTPGDWDTPAQTIAAWPLTDLQWIQNDLGALAKLLATGGQIVRYSELVLPGQRSSSRFRELHINEVPALLGVRDDPRLSWNRTDYDLAVRQLYGEVARVMKLAAMLHADIAVFGPPRHDVVPAVDVSPGTHQYVWKVSDGQGTGPDEAPIHWEIGRVCLLSVRPDAANDEFVRRWYRATSAYQEHRRQYGYAKPHLQSAREVLPNDAYVQFYSGVMQEDIAAPPVQVFVQAAESAGGYSGVSRTVGLQGAEGFLRRAVDLDAALQTAHIRLARVISLRGRHEEAAALLRRVLPSLTSQVDRYYALLFLGAEERTTGHSDAARAALEQAAALFPLAQSPRLALSQLAWQSGDRAGARAAFLALADLPSLDRDRPDPWWDYDIAPVADSLEQLTALRALAVKEKEKLVIR